MKWEPGFYGLHTHRKLYMVVSQNRGTQNTIVLVIGTPKMVPPILGNSKPKPHGRASGSQYVTPVSQLGGSS